MSNLQQERIRIREAYRAEVEKNKGKVPLDLREAKVRIANFPKNIVVHLPLLVTGTPRSGTRAIAAGLTNARFLVGHERSGPRGISSSFFAARDWYYPGTHRAPLSQYRFDHVWHQTRHPLKTISSMADEMPISWWHWQEKSSGVAGDLEPVGFRCGLFWVRWSRLIERNHPQAWQYRIEDVNELWPQMCERLGIPSCEYTPDNDHGHNKKKDDRHQYTWDEMKSLDVEMYDDLRFLAQKYGYDE